MKTLRLFLLAIVSAAAAAWGWRRVDVGAGTLPAPGAAAPSGIAVSAAAAEKAELEEALKGLPDGPLADWARRIAAAQAADFPRLREEIEHLAREDQDEIRSLLMARWAEVDPAAAWAASGGWDLRSLVLAVWLQRDFSAAAAALERLGENATRELELAANRLLDDDPETFWRIATARRCTPVWGDPRWEALVRSHEDEAAALAREVIGGRKKTDSRYAPWETLKTVHQAEAERDPLGAMQRAQALPENERKLALCVVLPFAAKADLEAATAAVLTLRSLENCPSPGAPGIPQVLSAIAQDLGRRDPKAALDWLRRVDPERSNLGDAQGQVLAAAMREGRLSPQEAFGLVCAGAKDPEAAWSTASNETWRSLPAATLGDAAAWLRDRTQDSTAASDALHGVLQAWSRVDRQGAIAFAAGLPAEKQAPLLRAMLFPQVDSDDPQSEIDAAFPAFGSENGAPVSPIRDEMPLQPGFDRVPAAARASLIEHDLELQGKLLQRWGFDGPAYAEALDGIGDPAGTRSAATRLARLWGEFDATAAMAWAQRQTDTETQRAAVAATMDGWAAADAWGASEWLARQAAGPDRDIAAEQLAHSIRQDEPEAAWKWAATIADPTGRARALESVLETWAKTDASEARSALENAGSVDEATLSRLRQILSSAEPPANPSR